MTEDIFVTPEAWRRSILPRRGGLPVTHRPVAGWRDTVTRSLADGADSRGALTHPATPAQIRDEGLAYLDAWLGAPGTGGAITPLGAAAVAVTVVGPSDRWSGATSAAHADGWVAGHGLAFAVCAGVELVELHVETPYRADLGPRAVQRVGGHQVSLHGDTDGGTLVLHRLRVAMAGAADDEHDLAVAALAAKREERLTVRQRAAVSFLAPGRRDWVAADVDLVGGDRGEAWSALTLHASITEPGQFEALGAGSVPWHLLLSGQWLRTLAEGLGAGGLPVFRALLSERISTTEVMRALLDVVAAVPSDEAFQVLLDWSDERAAKPFLIEAADRFPRRALRMLAAAVAGGSQAAGMLLAAHASRHRAVAEEMTAGLPPRAAARVADVLAQLDAVRPAPVEALPAVLADPPWLGAAKARTPVVVAGLACADETVLRWEPGERDTWRGLERAGGGSLSPAEVKRVAWDLRHGGGDPFRQLTFFVDAPEEIAGPLVAAWRPGDLWDAGAWLRIIVGRFEMDAWPVVLDAARREPMEAAPALMAFAGPEAAVLIAEWHSRLKTLRGIATQWLHRHPEAAARALVPPALGKPGLARRHAERALLVLAAGHRDLVEAVAGGYGAAAAAGIAQLLDMDPLLQLPAKIPATPNWADPAQLAPVDLVGGAGCLPADAVRHLLTMLAMSKLTEPYAGLDHIRQACTPGSLAGFGWSLFEQWRMVGAPAKDGWVLDALAFLGDDGTVRRLAPVIRAWPGEGGHSKAVAALDVLAWIGTDVALMHLHGISQKVKFKGLKERAQEKIAEVAAALELTTDQLADRLVPDFGLDDAGTLTIDYGPRRFTVGFDEQLKPFVVDGSGVRRKDLPKPGAKDDPDLAPAGAARFAALKKDVRTVAADQIHRFEQAMVMQRRWTGAEFRQLIVGHPLVWHVARRLVWATFDAGIATMRLAEDRSFADVADNPVTIADDAVVGVAHPLHLTGKEAWAEVFADYEILQPFPQLARDTYALTDAERDATDLSRCSGVKAPATKILGLERRGWRRAAPEDSGMQPAMERPLPGGALLIAELDPGFLVGDVAELPEQAFGEVWIVAAGGTKWTRDRPHTFGELDPVTVSEIIRDLREVTL